MATHLITALKQGATVIDGIVDSRINPGIELFIAGADSQKYNHYLCVNEARPVASFTTLKIAAAITQFGIDGAAISATPLDLYTVDSEAAGSRGSTGEKVSITKGLIVPRQLVAVQGQWATITYDVFMGGTTADAAPFAVTSDQTSPTGIALDELFTLGEVKLNSADIGPCQNYTLDFGFAVDQVMADGKVYPVQVYWRVQQPIITATTLLPEALATITVPGTSNTMTFQLQKCLEGGTRAGSGHKTFTTNENYVHVETFGGSHNDLAHTEINCVPCCDGTNAPIVVS